MFGGKSIESTLYSIDAAVDKTFDNKDRFYTDDDGVQQNNRQTKRFSKYHLAFQMACNLPAECKDLKPYLLKTQIDYW